MPLPIFKHLQAENRRLRALNEELLAALIDVADCSEVADPVFEHARAVIAKAEQDGHDEK
jgi:hypothetical protein